MIELDPQAYWETLLAIAWANRSDPMQVHDVRLVREALSGPGEDLSGVLVERNDVREAYARIMKRARFAADWQTYAMDTRGFSASPKEVNDLIFRRSPTLRDVSLEGSDKPGPFLLRLLEIKGQVEEELAAFGDLPFSAGGLSIYRLVAALEVAGQLPPDYRQTYRREIGHSGLYERSPTLKKIVRKHARDSLMLVRRIAKARQRISAEIASGGRSSQVGEAGHTVATLVSATEAVGVLKKGVQTAKRFANSYDVFRRSPTFMAISDVDLSDDRSLMKFLLARRDRIAVENLHALGKLKPEEFNFRGSDEHYSLGRLAGALYAAGIIGKTRANRLLRTIVGPLQYYLDNRYYIAQMDRIIRAYPAKTPRSILDPSEFRWTSDPSKQHSYDTIFRIIRWGRWFYYNPDIVTRSIYGADELPDLKLTRYGTPPLKDLLPTRAAARLKVAARRAGRDPIGARRLGFAILREVVRVNPLTDKNLPEDERDSLRLIERLVEWNSDAFETAGTASGGGGGPRASIRSSPTLPRAFYLSARMFSGLVPARASFV